MSLKLISPSSRELDIAGQRFGRLVCLGKTADKHQDSGEYLWAFKCDCGETVMRQKRNVASGRTISCGCYRSEVARSEKFKRASVAVHRLQATDMTGRRLGTFVVVKRLEGNGAWWLCRCKCGYEFEAKGRMLRAEQVRHCPRCRKYRERRPAEVGQKFGRLTVIEYLHTVQGKGRILRCRCECGGITDVPAKCLRAGNTKSCGCLRREKLPSLVMISINNLKLALKHQANTLQHLSASGAN